ncbi:MAG: GGDEF domain-containing protein [Desulfobacterales bacterium]
MAEEISRSRRYQLDLTLIMIDIDFFKHFNDQYGHLAGDQVLKRVAGIIADQARKSDIAASYGGEEFAVILPETSPAAGRQFAERLRKTIETTSLDGYAVTISLGVSARRPQDASPEAFIQRADQALYRAKQLGRNRVGFDYELAQ